MNQYTDQEFRDHVATLKLPEGWTATWGEENWFDKTKWLTYKVTNPEGNIRLTFKQIGDGTTEFQPEGKGWYSFDRTGVESSFYSKKLWGPDEGGLEDLNAILTEQVARAQKRLEYYRTAVTIPGFSYTVPPDGIQRMKDELKKKGFLSFHPSGFGTGYRLCKKQPKHRYGVERAKPETEAFFGITPLWIEKFDCD